MLLQFNLSAYSFNGRDFILCLKDACEILTSMIGKHVFHKVGYTYNGSLSTNFDFVAALSNKFAFLVACWPLMNNILTYAESAAVFEQPLKIR